MKNGLLSAHRRSQKRERQSPVANHIDKIEQELLDGIANNAGKNLGWARLALKYLEIKHNAYSGDGGKKLSQDDIMDMWDLWQGDGDEEQDNTVDIEEIKKCKKL